MKIFAKRFLHLIWDRHRVVLSPTEIEKLETTEETIEEIFEERPQEKRDVRIYDNIDADIKINFVKTKQI